MRRKAIFAVGISAAAVSLYGLSVSAADASSPAAASHGTTTVAVAHSSKAVSGSPASIAAAKCGTHEGTWTQDGITAQNGAPTNPSLNTWGAKQVKCGGVLKTSKLVVDGYPSQFTDIKFNVAVYKNTKKYNTARYNSDPQPNDATKALCSYTDAPGTYAAAGVTGAQWTIKLPTVCKVAAKFATKGVWFAVQADYDQVNGQWFWATQTAADVPNEADFADTQNLFRRRLHLVREAPVG